MSCYNFHSIKYIHLNYTVEWVLTNIYTYAKTPTSMIQNIYTMREHYILHSCVFIVCISSLENSLNKSFASFFPEFLIIELMIGCFSFFVVFFFFFYIYWIQFPCQKYTQKIFSPSLQLVLSLEGQKIFLSIKFNVKFFFGS